MGKRTRLSYFEILWDSNGVARVIGFVNLGKEDGGGALSVDDEVGGRKEVMDDGGQSLLVVRCGIIGEGAVGVLKLAECFSSLRVHMSHHYSETLVGQFYNNILVAIETSKG